MTDSTEVPIVTLDGPSGTGKGTISSLLAQKLGWHYLDSGAIYRVLAFSAIQNKISSNDESELINIAIALPLRFSVNASGNSEIFYGEKNVTAEIRSTQCGQKASELAVIKSVRKALLQKQRAFSVAPGLVTDGRDMGTVVFPEAFLKIYMDAEPEERAKRRCFQLQNSKKNASLAQVLEEIKERDKRDLERAVAPLKPAVDAVKIDTTNLSVLQVYEAILQLIRQRMPDY